jgi:hypothetical protein
MFLAQLSKKPFWLQILVVGFIALGATCFAGIGFFFLLNVAGRRQPSPTASVPPPAPQQQQQAPPVSPAAPPAAAPASPKVKAFFEANRQGQPPFISHKEVDPTESDRSTVKPGSTVERTADQFKAFSNTSEVPQNQQEATANLAKEMGLEVRSTGRGYYEIGRTLKGGRVSSANPPDQSGFPTNTAVADRLNDADSSFGDGGSDGEIWGCRWVNIAISEANDSRKPTGPAQRAEVKRYADRCNLRFQP